MRKARNLTRRSTALRVALVVCALGVCVVASWYFMSTLSGSAPSSKDGSAASESEGTRRAVLAGVHVFKGAAPLQYTLNDVEDMGDVLRERCRFTEIAELAKRRFSARLPRSLKRRRKTTSFLLCCPGMDIVIR